MAEGNLARELSNEIPLGKDIFSIKRELLHLSNELDKDYTSFLKSTNLLEKSLPEEVSKQTPASTLKDLQKTYSSLIVKDQPRTCALALRLDLHRFDDQFSTTNLQKIAPAANRAYSCFAYFLS